MYNKLYTPTEWASIRSRCRFDAVKDASELFKASCASSVFDSRYAGIRESRDADNDHSSTPLIIGFDVTGGNDFIAKALVTHIVNELIFLRSGCISGGCMHFMFAGIGDITNDMTPLQVTDFRSDIGLYDDLMRINLEKGGSGDGVSYNLLWYYASRHIRSDHFEKRGRKGFLFTIGTNACRQGLSVVDIGRTCGDDISESLTNNDLFSMAEQQFNVFHIHLADGSAKSKQVFNKWREEHPTHVTEIKAEDIDLLPELIASIMTYVAGGDVQSIMKSLVPEIAVKLARPLGFIINDNRSGGSIIF